eukprot:jgi/Astpho2/4173/Aster-05140
MPAGVQGAWDLHQGEAHLHRHAALQGLRCTASGPAAGSPSAAGGGAAVGHRRGHRSGRITPGGRPRAGRQVGCSFKVLTTWPALWDADICCHLPQRCMQQHIGPTISGGLQAIVCPAVLPICCSTSWGMWCWLIWASRARWIRSLKCGLCKAGHF